MSRQLSKYKTHSRKRNGEISYFQRLEGKIEIGQIFDQLTVIEKLGHEKKQRTTIWKCQCNCGNIIKIPSRVLRLKTRHRSCGCHKGKNNFFSYLNWIKLNYQNSAKKRQLVYTLTDKELQYLIKSNCYYCGSKPSNHIQNRNQKNDAGLDYNGIDRLNNSMGYTNNNCVPCCKECNFAKWNKTEEDFKDWIDRLVNYQLQIYPEKYLGESNED